MKKISAFILAMVMILSMAACGKNKEDVSATGSSDATKGATDATVSATGGNQNTVAGNASGDNSTDGTADGTNPSQGATTAPSQGSGSSSSQGSTPSQGSGSTSSGTTSSPAQGSGSSQSGTSTPSQNTTTPPASCSHSYQDATCTTPKTCTKCGATEGSVAAHKWQEATCLAAKTCSACKKTEGNKADHVISGTTCKWCKQVVAVSPSNFNPNVIYTYLGARYSGDAFHMPSEYDCYVLTILDFKGIESHQAGVYGESSSLGYHSFHHNGKYYSSIAQASEFGYDTTYKIEGSEIVAQFTGIDEAATTGNTIRFVVLSDGSLKVTAISGYQLPEHAAIPVGAIFLPNSTPYVNEDA